MHILKKLVAGDDMRPSRLHTEAGQFCGMGAIPGLAPSGVTWTRARLTGRHAALPWWVWDAIRFVGERLRRSDRVLEVGGGLSTLWLAQRCGAVVSIEESWEWRDHIADQAQRAGIRNVQLQEGPSWPAFRSLFAATGWDVVVIDASAERLRMFEEIMGADAGRRPRLVIFDDTDRAENRAALECAGGYEVRSYRGFKPQTLHACETSVFLQDAARA